MIIEPYWQAVLPVAATAALLGGLAVVGLLRLMSPDPGARWGFLRDRRCPHSNGGQE